MPESTDKSVNPRTWRPMALWTVGILLAVGLAWFVAAMVVPVWLVRKAAINCDNDQRMILGEVKRLGGPEKTLQRLLLLLRLPGLDEERNRYVPMLVGCGDAAIPHLVRLLADKDGAVRRQAVWALGKGGNQDAIEPLMRVLSDQNAPMRMSVAIALGELKATQSIDALLKATADARGDADYGARFYAARALVKVGAEKQAVEPLIACLTSNNSVWRASTAEMLGQIGDVRAVAPLAALLLDPDIDDSNSGKHGDSSVGVREAAALALGKIGDPSAVPALIAPLRSVSGNDRYASTKALVMIGTPSIQPLLASFAHTGKDGAQAEALAAFGSQAVDPSIAALRDKQLSPTIRAGAAIALSLLGDTRAVEPLMAALGDTDATVRLCAVRALGDLCDSRSVDALIAALNDGCWGVRNLAAYALGKLRSAKAIPALEKALRDENQHVRSTAAEALKKIRDAAAPRAAPGSWPERKAKDEAAGDQKRGVAAPGTVPGSEVEKEPRKGDDEAKKGLKDEAK